MKEFYELGVRAQVPTQVVLEVTYRCNLKCIHCYVVDRKKRELSIDEYREILSDLAELGTLIITVTGGEPFVRSDIKDLLKLISDYGFAIRIFTAGSYIDTSMADFLEDLNVLEVEMSIYGSNPQIHESVTRVPGSFKKLINAMNLLIEKGIKTHMKFIAMKHNYRDVLNVKKMVEDAGANFYYDVLLTPRDDLSTIPLNYRLSKEEIKEFYQLVRSRDWKIKIRDRNEYICNAGVSTMAVSPYGDVYPCVQLRIKAGSVLEKNIKEIWNHAEIFNFLRSRRIKDYNCGSCPLFDYCNPCIGSIWLETGSVDGCTDVEKSRAEVLKEILRNGE